MLNLRGFFKSDLFVMSKISVQTDLDKKEQRKDCFIFLYFKATVRETTISPSFILSDLTLEH